jgi:cytidylate kinase
MKRIVTISRLLGAGGSAVAERVARELGYELADKELIHQEAQMIGILEPRVDHLDERAPGFLERLGAMKGIEGYFRALQRIMAEYASRDGLVIVGRGGNLFLEGTPAYHVRLVAQLGDRIRRVMERRWVVEEVARHLIEECDRQRAAFHRHFFHVDWNDPRRYHTVINTSRLSLELTADLIVGAVRDANPSDE